MIHVAPVLLEVAEPLKLVGIDDGTDVEAEAESVQILSWLDFQQSERGSSLMIREGTLVIGHVRRNLRVHHRMVTPHGDQLGIPRTEGFGTVFHGADSSIESDGFGELGRRSR